MCWSRRCAVSLAVLLVAGQGHAQTVTGFGKWFDEQIGRRVTLSGWRRLSYHTRTVTGDREAYDLTEYGGRGLSPFTDFGQVHINGSKVLGILNFDVNIQDSRFEDPQANRVSVDIDRGPWTANLGDIRGSLASENRFARFEKSLTGGQFGYKDKRLQVRAVYSDVRGQPRTVSLQGNNSAGPYYLQSSQILRGSERILVDGVAQKFGEDYTMDYDLGSVTFVNRLTFEGRIIPPTSTIVATYEVLGFNGTKGRVEGASVGYDLGRAGRIGLTGMRQTQGGVARDSTFQQQFLGPITAGSSLILRYEPLDILTVKVYIGSVLQTLGSGYRFNANNSSLLIMLRDVPPSTILTVIYTPKPVNTVQGDRDIVGLDYRLPLGNRGSLVYSQAIGRLTNSATPKSGTARGLDLVYRTGKVEVVGGVRDVPDGYVSIETVGFSRNEKAAQVGVHVTPSDRFSYGLDHQNVSIQTLDTSSKTVASRYSQISAFADFRPKSTGGLPWRIDQSRTSSRGPAGGSQVDTTSIGTSGHAGRSDWRLNLMNQFADGQTTVDGVREKRKLNLQTLEYRLNYRAGRAWDLDLNSSLSRVATAGKTSIGRDLLFGVNFRPNDRLSVRAQIADSDAGRLATLGFVGGSGFGYGGNGFSAGTDESTFNTATNARNANLTVNWDANDRLTFNGNLFYYKTSGGVSSNTETLGFGIGANWSPNDATNIDATLDTSTTSFVDSPLRSTASTLSLYANGSPKGRLSYRGGVNVLLTSGNSQFNQDSLSYELALNYSLARRHNLSFSMDNGRLSGFLPQETRNMAVTYQYQIWRSLALNIGYRVIDVVNRDANVPGGEYSSRGFDFELQFNFGR